MSVRLVSNPANDLEQERHDVFAQLNAQMDQARAEAFERGRIVGRHEAHAARKNVILFDGELLKILAWSLLCGLALAASVLGMTIVAVRWFA